jgi:hypothetical protein
MFLAIINGHHRVRSASKFGIRHIPCEVTTPAQLLNIVNNSDKDDNHLSEQKLVDNLMNYMMDASNSFSQAIPNYVKPSTVLDAVDINDLKNRFAPFDSTKNIQNNRLIGGDIYDRE